MIKTRTKHNNKLLKLCVAFLFPFSLFGGVMMANQSYAVNTADYVYYYEENVELTNSSFTQGSTPYASGNSLSGWEAIETESKATGMLIDVGSGTNSDPDDSSTNSFSKYQDTYMLKTNPGTKGSDSRIMMINSKANQDNSQQAQKGYRSSQITLEANSFYRFSVSVKTSLNGENDVCASMYVSGLKDKDGNAFQVGYENLNNSIWKDYYVFIATGDEAQTVTIDLYLGSANGLRSHGAVFFDEIHINRYSENSFFELCKDFGYQDKDTFKTFDAKTVFLVDGLQNEGSFIDTSAYNFDFEKKIEQDTNTLGDEWKVVGKSNGHAIISEIRDMQPSDFKALTGYSYVGDDLSYDNSQAMILYTGNGNSSEYSSGYVGVQSKDIDIKAHGIYKITLKVKLAEVSAGSFYLKIEENDTIYTLYPEILSDDEDAKNYYQLQNGKTSGISANVENNFTNDYQTVELFVKGHSLYDTSANIQLWLGDNSTAANGCVVVDNIQVEYATYEEFSGASNQVEFKSFANAPSTITNGYFNSSNLDNTDFEYPIKASDWTTNLENEKINESGIIYLYNSDSYKELYANKYDWAGIYPGNPVDSNSDTPNNVYMMYNKFDSYQSITSAAYNLVNNSYYKLSFNYYNQNSYSSSNNSASKIKVEVVDGDGITLFSKSGISSIGQWNTMEIFFHTAETVSHDIQVKVSLGDEDNKVCGLVYLDNFIVEESNETAFESAKYHSDLTDYYLNLNPDNNISNEITSSPAYNLDIGAIYDSNYSDENKDLCAVGGIVSGKENPYQEINSELKIEDSNFLAITTKVASEATLTSKYKFNLESGKFYKVTFDLATIFNIGADDADTDEHKCAYGVKIGIEGFDDVKELVTADQLKSFTIYLKCTETTNPTIKFTLVSDCDKTLGTALLTHLDFTSVEEDEYNSASLSQNYEKTIFTAKQNSSTEEEDDNPDEEETTPEGDAFDSKWLLIPSIIMGVALIVAIVGYILKHIKIKKIEKIKKETYDRKLSINHDVVLVEAQKRRDKEFNDLQKAKKMLEQEKVDLDNAHKDYVRENRMNANGKISKDVENAFKQYNKNISRIEEKINIINEKIDYTMSADYLLSIERKIVAEEEEKFKTEKKEFKDNLKKQLKIEKEANKKSEVEKNDVKKEETKSDEDKK